MMRWMVDEMDSSWLTMRTRWDNCCGHAIKCVLSIGPDEAFVLGRVRADEASNVEHGTGEMHPLLTLMKMSTSADSTVE